MEQFSKIFSCQKPIIAMVHVNALPGTPKNNLSVSSITDKALEEVEIYKSAGVDALMIENMHDVPYLNSKVGPEITAAMTAIAIEIRRNFNKPLGIQILAAANKEALAVAKCADFDFIRAEGFVYGHVADEGYIDSCAGDLLRYRKQIDAEHISIYTDIKKKHSSHNITSDVNIAETANAADFFLSDGVIITGNSTGKQASIEELNLVKKQINIPVFVGSGIDANNINSYLSVADGFIIGSAFKKQGNWANEIDPDYVTNFMKIVNSNRHES